MNGSTRGNQPLDSFLPINLTTRSIDAIRDEDNVTRPFRPILDLVRSFSDSIGETRSLT